MVSILPKFNGRKGENHYAHLTAFEYACNSVNEFALGKDAFRLRLFPFSLEGEAVMWLNEQPPLSLSTWDDLYQAFVRDHFPHELTNDIREQISGFKIEEDEAFYKCWKRFGSLIRQCPHHGYSKVDLLTNFYNGLDPQSKQNISSMSQCTFMDMEEDRAWTFLTKFAEESKGWTPGIRDKNRSYLSDNSKTSTSDSAMLEKKIDKLETMLSKLAIPPEQPAHHVSMMIKAQPPCEICGQAHHVSTCTATANSVAYEEVNAFNYGPKRMNGFSWSDPNNSATPADLFPPNNNQGQSQQKGQGYNPNYNQGQKSWYNPNQGYN
jgi:hypothetical protein